MTNTLPERELRRLRRRGAASSRSTPRADQADLRLGRRRRAGCRCRSPRPRPRAPCPGGSTGRAWRGGTSPSPTARTAAPVDLAGGGVDAAGHVGGDDRRAARRSSPRSRPRPARAARPVEAGAEQRVDDPGAPSSRAASNGRRRVARQAVELRLRVAAAATRGGHTAQHVDLAAGLRAAAARRRARRRRCCPCRRRSRSARRARARRPRARAPPPRAPSARATGRPAPRSPRRRSRASRPRRAAAPASGAGSSAHRHGCRHAARVRERDRRPSSPSSAARAAARAGQPHGRRLVAAAERPRRRASSTRAAASAFATASLAQKRAARCIAGRAPRGRVRPLAVGEQPLGQPRAPRERALEALDLQQVDADACHAAATLPAGPAHEIVYRG